MELQLLSWVAKVLQRHQLPQEFQVSWPRNCLQHEQQQLVHKTHHHHLHRRLPHHSSVSVMTQRNLGVHLLLRPHLRVNDHHCYLTNAHTHGHPLLHHRCASSSHCRTRLRADAGNRSRRLHHCHRCFRTGDPFHQMPMILCEIPHLRAQVSPLHAHQRNQLRCFSICLFLEVCLLEQQGGCLSSL